MMNEFEIANFITVLDSINLLDLGPDINDSEGVLKLASQCIFYAAYYAKVKFGDED